MNDSLKNSLDDKFEKKFGMTYEEFEHLSFNEQQKIVDLNRKNKDKDKNKYYTPSEKERIINRILLNNETVNSVAIDEGLLSKGLLVNWIKKYKEMGYNIVERKRGRLTMNKKELNPKKRKHLKKKMKD